MKYPKEWVSRLCNYLQSRYDNPATEQAETILNALSQLGALKEPPKPREWWMCESGVAWNTKPDEHYPGRQYKKCPCKLIHVTETVDE